MPPSCFASINMMSMILSRSSIIYLVNLVFHLQSRLVGLMKIWNDYGVKWFKWEWERWRTNVTKRNSNSASATVTGSTGVTGPGASIPLWDHDAFSPCFRFSPYFRKIFRLWGKFLKFDLFRKNFLIFFSHRPQIFNFPPIFAVSVHFPPVSRKLLFPPYFDKFFPLFYRNSPAFYLLYVCFVSPEFYHDAFMHYPMHVLDASALDHVL